MTPQMPYHLQLRPTSAIHFGVMTVNRGERIQRRRLMQGLDQRDLAQLAKISVRTLGRIEAGHSETSRAIPRLEAALGITDDEPPTRMDGDTEPQARRLDEVTLGEATRLELIQQLLRLELDEQRALSVELPKRPFSWPWQEMPVPQNGDQYEGDNDK